MFELMILLSVLCREVLEHSSTSITVAGRLDIIGRGHFRANKQKKKKKNLCD